MIDLEKIEEKVDKLLDSETEESLNNWLTNYRMKKVNQYIDKRVANEKLEERRLVITAEIHPNEDKAESAMKELREKYDKTYFWCWDCDGLVTKEKNCCLNLPDK